MSGNLIKDENLKLLRDVLRKEKEATKSQLAEKTGLSVVTIQSLMKILLEQGEAVEGEIVQPKLGRPAATYRFNECVRLALVIYMYEKDRIDTAVCQVCDLYGNCIEKIEESLPEVTKESYDVMVKAMITKYPAIQIIALGLPVVAREGVILASDYPKLLEVDLGGYLQERFARQVIIVNDINAAVFGYAASTEENRIGCTAGIYMPTKYPPGAGICLDGKVQSGRNGLIGEIKMLPPYIDWENFSYEKEAVENFLLEAMRALFCFYNPDRLVVYSEIMDEGLLRKLEENCNNPIEKMLIPAIEIKQGLKDDFAAGMIQLALQKIL
ncbi:MAG: ROK family protein [Lachnospiraceae bacterium]|nr:ROK family protein [Lachnospiraceae bacterium]